MMRTFSSGVLGLQTHQTQMDVISNNIANVNNYGFKKGRVIFKDILSQTIANGQAPIGTLGGINPMQVGLGTKIGSIDNVFTQGALQNTGRELDIAIQGDGFFVTTDGTNQYYTRTGTLDLDSTSNLIHSGSANKIMGWTAKEDSTTHALKINTSDKLEAINFAQYNKLPAASTAFVEFASNLQNSAAERNLPEERLMVYYDDTGAQQSLKIRFTKLDKSNWLWTAIDDTQGQVGTGKLVFDENGKITTSTGGPVLTFDPDGATGTPPTLTLQPNNSANLTAAQLKSLEPSTWASSFALSKNGIPVTDMNTKMSELFDNTSAAAAQFDLRGLDGDESLVVSGVDGNGIPIAEKTIPIGPNMTMTSLIDNLKIIFPNAVPTYNSTTGKIQITDASPGTKDILKDIKFNFVNPNDAAIPATFPGLTTTTTPTLAQAGGFTELSAAAGTVQSGVHSITVTKVAATSSNITGAKTGLSRFTTFGDLDIGDVSNFKISIDNQAPVQLSGLSAGNYGTLVGANALSAPPAGGYIGGSVIVNGNLVSWNTAEVSGFTQGQMGNFVANRINTLFRGIQGADPTNPNTAYSTFDSVTNKLSIAQTHRGSAYKVSIQNVDAVLGFDSTQSVAYGTNGSTISDFIDAINSQVGGITAEMQGDRVAVKRSITGSAANISIIPTVAGSATTYPAAPGAQTDPAAVFGSSTFTINDAIFGTSTPVTVLGSEQAFNLLDVFTPAAGGASVELKYNNIRDGQIIGNSNIGEIILNSANFQSGTATITTTNERNANSVKINVPTVNSYSANFSVNSGGVSGSDVSVTLMPGAVHNIPMNVYDSGGQAHKMNMQFEKVEAGKWIYRASLDQTDPLIKEYFVNNPPAGSTPTDTELKLANETIVGSGTGLLAFNNVGKVDSTATAFANGVILPDYIKPISFTPKNANKVEFKPNFDLVTQYDGAFSTAVKSSDGYAMGKLDGFLIEDSGVIKGSYTNGQKIAVAQLGIAKFVNNAGLEKFSDNLYAEGSNSGKAAIGAASADGRGKLASQNLEMANVDLAKEFTDMITSQRGFQANSKSITTADQMLQDILALKR